MRHLVSLGLFFGILIVLITIHKRLSGFKGGFGAGVGGSGAAYQEIGFQDLNEADLGDFGSSAEFFSEQKEKNKAQVSEAFENIGPATVVTGKSEIDSTDGPADATLDTPRKPYNLLEQLPAAPRGSISCLKASCCAETDFEWRTNLTGNFLQRTNNYKREFPDNCSAPLTEMNLAFYKNSVLQKV
jgi:hypothetical protein